MLYNNGIIHKFKNRIPSPTCFWFAHNSQPALLYSPKVMQQHHHIYLSTVSWYMIDPSAAGYFIFAKQVHSLPEFEFRFKLMFFPLGTVLASLGFIFQRFPICSSSGHVPMEIISTKQVLIFFIQASSRHGSLSPL